MTDNYISRLFRHSRKTRKMLNLSRLTGFFHTLGAIGGKSSPETIKATNNGDWSMHSTSKDVR